MAEAPISDLGRESQSCLAQIAESKSHTKKLVEDLEMLWVEVVSRDTRITDLESGLSEAEETFLKVEEGQTMAEFDLVRSREAKGTTLDYPGRESARAASFDAILASAEHSQTQTHEELQSTKAILDESELLESHFHCSASFRPLERELQQV